MSVGIGASPVLSTVRPGSSIKFVLTTGGKLVVPKTLEGEAASGTEKISQKLYLPGGAGWKTLSTVSYIAPGRL